ncbi:hypothetical protein MCEMSEM23_00480 [Rhabdaerophilaceae bacterium]
MQAASVVPIQALVMVPGPAMSSPALKHGRAATVTARSARARQGTPPAKIARASRDLPLHLTMKDARRLIAPVRRATKPRGIALFVRAHHAMTVIGPVIVHRASRDLISREKAEANIAAHGSNGHQQTGHQEHAHRGIVLKVTGQDLAAHARNDRLVIVRRAVSNLPATGPMHRVRRDRIARTVNAPPALQGSTARKALARVVRMKAMIGARPAMAIARSVSALPEMEHLLHARRVVIAPLMRGLGPREWTVRKAKGRCANRV